MYCSAIQHPLLFPGSMLPVTAPASTVERDWETAVFIFGTRSAKPELLSTLFLGNYVVLSKCTRLLHSTYLQGPLVFGDCVSWKLPNKFLSKQSPRHCETVYRQSCSGPAGCHPPSSPLSRSPVTVMYSKSSIFFICPQNAYPQNLRLIPLSEFRKFLRCACSWITNTLIFIIANPQLFHLRPEKIKRLFLKVSPVVFHGKTTYMVIRPRRPVNIYWTCNDESLLNFQTFSTPWVDKGHSRKSSFYKKTCSILFAKI